MKFGKLSDYKNGWLVGKFNPSLYHSEENDVGVLFVEKGDESDGHYHTKHTEYNVILSGKVIVNKKELISGDIFIYEPYDRSLVYFVENTILLVLKSPATYGDKYYE